MNASSPPQGGLSAIKLALMAKQTRLQAGQILRSDPIAVIGIGCRVPGGATTADEIWHILRAGAQNVRDVPADRWDLSDWYDSDPVAPGKSLFKEASFLERIDMFDSGYFGILPREADRMDPQQRLLLEVAIEAIDDAGLPHPQLRGSRTSVYTASYHSDYAQLQYGNPEDIDARTLTGTLHSVIPNRLSYLLDLRGPSVSVDSACSSSLTAIHLACQGLRSGETDLAIAGGVSLMMTPELTVAMSKVGFMAPDGRCKTFDALADGFGRGEGCGIVVLKRLSDAIADNDRIHGVIRGSAVNQDGRSTLLAAPSGPAQEALIREALHNAQLDAHRICFFETHGTGTALGDPIEVEAIAATVGRPDESGSTCWLGAAKANFGHLEAAAGVVGLIKVIQVLRHGTAPPQPYFTKLNPHISLAGTRLAVPTALTPLPLGAFPRCAAVSSFGVGGTNANIIVEESPTLPPEAGVAPVDTCRILPLSAHSPEALEALVKSWTGFVAETPATIDDLSQTAALRRTHYDYRVAVTARSRDELRTRLEALSKDAAIPVHDAAQGTPRVGFVFCGQGPQWFAMGRELLTTEAPFREVVEICDELLRPLARWSLLEELNLPEDRSRLGETEIAQPAIFAIQVALAALWKAWGVSPNCVIGHSVGEIAALHVAGALDLPEAIRIVFHRAKIMQRATGNGRMAAVGLSEAEAADIVAPFGSRLGIGAINGPRSVVLSGEGSALDEVLARLQRRNVGYRMLPVNYAFHSAQMAALKDEFVTQLGRVRAADPSIRFISTVTGTLESTRPGAEYFGRNMREPVRFAAAAREMMQDCDLIIEIGPHPVLGAVIADCANSQPTAPVVLASLRRGRPERETMLQACAGVYAAGRDINWKNVQVGLGQIVDLPAYPWQRRRHWISVGQGRALQSEDGMRARVKVTEDLYRVAWLRISNSPTQDADATGTWLVFADDGGTAVRFADKLRKSGGRAVIVTAGDAYHRISMDEFVLDPAAPEDIGRLFLDGGWSDAKPLRSVIDCWPLDLPRGDDRLAPGERDPASLGTGTALRLVKTLATASALTSGSLILVSRGGAAVNEAGMSGDLCPRAAGLWGLAGVIAIEHPELRVRIVDLDPQDGPDNVAALYSESLHQSDARVAFRARQRWVPRLLTYSHNGAASAEQPSGVVLTTQAGRANAVPRLVRDGTYWITGGLGGVGKETARWLARRGARYLVLTSRHADEAANRDFLAELSRSSVSCRILDGDAADRRRMGEIFDEIGSSMPPLRGVIHAAGVLRDAALINQNSADADEIRSGKVEGAWILHELTRDVSLDFFILFSAAGVVLGAPGQGMYSAANAELDALAQFRRSNGLPATSVAWGPWSGAGMAANLVARGQDVFTARGLAMIDPELGFSSLERLLVDGSPYGAVIPIDWTKFLLRLPDGADRGYYSMLTSAPKSSAAIAAEASSSSLERLKAIPAGQRRDALAAELTSSARQVIGLDDGTPIASTLPLREMGLDSLMAVELRNVLVRLGGQSLPATLLFDYPHLDALSSHLYRAWGLDFDATPKLGSAPSAAPAGDDLADLSDEEAESLLLAELANGDGARRRP
jgi:acyl transferase domain-containing protein